MKREFNQSIRQGMRQQRRYMSRHYRQGRCQINWYRNIITAKESEFWYNMKNPRSLNRCGLDHTKSTNGWPYLWRCLSRGLGTSASSIILAGKNQCRRAPQPRGSVHSLEGPNRRHRVFLTSVLMGKFWLESIV